MFEDKVRNSEELLRRRELAVKTMEATHDETLKSELSRSLNRSPTLLHHNAVKGQLVPPAIQTFTVSSQKSIS